MYRYYKVIRFSVALLIVIAASSCEDLVTVGVPPDQLGSQAVFQDDNTATSAMSGLYAAMVAGSSTSSMTLCPGMSADDFYNTTAGPYDVFSQNELTAGEPRISNVWSSVYNYIYQANSVIEGLGNSTAVSTDTKKRLTGEALFIRAFCHFYLVNLFGGVPLIISTSYQENSVKPRIPADQVYVQIIDDLVEAVRLLDGSPVEKTRPSKWAASALLSRVYLFNKDFQKAEFIASEVIGSGDYMLADSLDQVFLVGSEEAIWQLVPVQPGQNTWEASVFVPPSEHIPSFSITDSLISAFEADDQRLSTWTGSTTISNETYYYPAKYKARQGAEVTEYSTILRLAELYLIRAEARARQDKLAGPDGATFDINAIRLRAGLDATDALTKEQLLAAIEQERRVELFAEWGHRWFDLKRTARASEILKPQKGENWQQTDLLYPIPTIEIDKNISLIQNAGY